jgi:hypothetical protein
MTVVAVPQASVGDYIAAAVAGFLLRDSSGINRVSVPVKLGEYLGAGVPVVISSLVEWNQTLLGRSPAALAVDWFGASEARQADQVESVLTRLSRDRTRLRSSALALAQTRFTWGAYLSRVRSAYHHSLVAAETKPRVRSRDSLAGTRQANPTIQHR